MSYGWRPYQEWFPYFEVHVLSQFEAACREVMNTPKTVDSWCQNGAVCIFNNINSYTQAELAGAGVLLGLTPTIIAILGPSDTSLAFLSTERPMLSVLLASSTATLSVGYPFSRTSPLQPLSDALSTPWSVDRLLPWDLMGKPWLVSPIQYLLAAAATANTVEMSYEITRKTIVSWSCPNWAWVLGYSFVPLLLHVMGMVIFRATVQHRGRRERTISVDGDGGRQSHSPLARIWHWLLAHELRPCSERVLPQYKVQFGLGSQLLWWTPRALSYLQYLMGTAIFSSLMFVPISDAFPIIVRYGVSSVLARCIVGLELQSLKRKNKLSKVFGTVSSPRWEEFGSPNQRSLTIADSVEIHRP